MNNTVDQRNLSGHHFLFIIIIIFTLRQTHGPQHKRYSNNADSKLHKNGQTFFHMAIKHHVKETDYVLHKPQNEV